MNQLPTAGVPQEGAGSRGCSWRPGGFPCFQSRSDTRAVQSVGPAWDASLTLPWRNHWMWRLPQHFSGPLGNRTLMAHLQAKSEDPGVPRLSRADTWSLAAPQGSHLACTQQDSDHIFRWNGGFKEQRPGRDTTRSPAPPPALRHLTVTLCLRCQWRACPSGLQSL